MAKPNNTPETTETTNTNEILTLEQKFEALDASTRELFEQMQDARIAKEYEASQATHYVDGNGNKIEIIQSIPVSKEAAFLLRALALNTSGKNKPTGKELGLTLLNSVIKSRSTNEFISKYERDYETTVRLNNEMGVSTPISKKAFVDRKVNPAHKDAIEAMK